MKRLIRFLDRWLPESHRNDPVLLVRARTTASLLWFHILLTLSMQPIMFIYRSPEDTWVTSGLRHLFTLALSMIYIAVLYRFRASGSFRWAGITICTFTYVTAVWMSLIFGSFPHTMSLLFIVVPVLAFLIQGSEVGIVWTLIAIATEIALFFLAGQVPMPQTVLSDALFRSMSLVHLVMITAIVIGAFYISYILNEQLRTALFAERNRLAHQAHHDELTQLCNRRSFQEQLNMLSESPYHANFALALIDLNDFKQINDEHGHLIGDKVLQAFALHLRRAVRSTDIIARIGGDEFAVILSGANNRDDIEQIIDHIAPRINRSVTIDGLTFQIRASIGVALCNAENRGAEQLQKLADDAMYQAKREQRDYCLAGC